MILWLLMKIEDNALSLTFDIEDVRTKRERKWPWDLVMLKLHKDFAVFVFKKQILHQ